MPLIGSFPLATLADSPRNYSGCRLWLRADLGVTLNGSTVSALADQSGAGANAVQVTPAAQPVWGATSGPNNTPGMTFAGSQELLANAFDPLGSLQMDEFVVVVPGNTLGVLLDTTNKFEAGANGVRAEFLASGFNSFRGDSPAGGLNNAWRTTNPITISTPHIVEFQADRTVITEQVKILIDGVFVPQTLVINDDVIAAFVPKPMSIGANFDLSNGLNGVMCEVVVYNRLLSAQERSNVLRYLGTRYAITVP